MERKRTSARTEWFFWGLAVLCFLIPIIETGIMLNDEVQLRLWRQQGVLNFLRTTIVEEGIAKGRILGVIGNLKVLGYLSDNKYVFRIAQVSFLLIAIALFAVFIYRLFGRKKLAYCTALFIIAFLPITFEPSVPNAFIIVSMQPMICLLLSLIKFDCYMRSQQHREIVISMLLFLWGMFLYEFIVTYSVLFVLIYLGKQGKKRIDFKQFLTSCVFPVLTASLFYLILYFGQHSVLGTNYEGTTIGNISLQSIWSVLWPLFLSALPGYYLLGSEKYACLRDIYSAGTIEWIAVIFSLTTAAILSGLAKKDGTDCTARINCKRIVYSLASICVFCFLPSLPNAITAMYQVAIPEGHFLSIPVSIYLFFSASLGVSFIICQLLEKSEKLWIRCVIILTIAFMVYNVQLCNHTFSKVQAKDYARFESIEDIFEMQFWQQYEEYVFIAPSVYETRNALAIEEGHWTRYARLFGNDIEVVSDVGEKGSKYAFLVVQDNGYFYFTANEKKLLFSADTIENERQIAIIDETGALRIFNVGGALWNENGYYIYEIY